MNQFSITDWIAFLTLLLVAVQPDQLEAQSPITEPLPLAVLPRTVPSDSPTGNQTNLQYPRSRPGANMDRFSIPWEGAMQNSRLGSVNYQSGVTGRKVRTYHAGSRVDFLPPYQINNALYPQNNLLGSPLSVLIPMNAWRGFRPPHSHWWWNYCPAIRYSRPDSFHQYGCSIVTINDRSSNLKGAASSSWWLGIRGLELPKRGFGIDVVDPESPAALAGLKPGMIITSCNDIKIINTQTLASAIDQSSGVLKLLVVTGKDGQTKPIRVTMKPLVSSRF